jgi:hypothetical protein
MDEIPFASRISLGNPTVVPEGIGKITLVVKLPSKGFE